MDLQTGELDDGGGGIAGAGLSAVLHGSAPSAMLDFYSTWHGETSVEDPAMRQAEGLQVRVCGSVEDTAVWQMESLHVRVLVCGSLEDPAKCGMRRACRHVCLHVGQFSA